MINFLHSIFIVKPCLCVFISNLRVLVHFPSLVPLTIMYGVYNCNHVISLYQLGLTSHVQSIKTSSTKLLAYIQHLYRYYSCSSIWIKFLKLSTMVLLSKLESSLLNVSKRLLLEIMLFVKMYVFILLQETAPKYFPGGH